MSSTIPTATYIATLLLLFQSFSASFIVNAFATRQSTMSKTFAFFQQNPSMVSSNRSPTTLYNVYDDWRSDAVVDTMVLDPENIELCLEEFIDSNYGQQMFGKHDRPASVGITGEIYFVEQHGPEVILALSGKFWHRRETVLGRAAMWLNARMPEITDVNVEDPNELLDYEEIIDDMTGEVLYAEDKRAPDFNGDRETMEYQGIDPDVRGPFPPGVLGSGGSMINPV
uniref:Uncharacterized protein n=1 Tax=Ditylum brightwellii TaxID=49249 RepID=A0A6U4A8F7_9STRA|mmetsp:Transcript_10389/g.15345  ORF Transcript_10389/g.15345 Transcript_10389/m.15345 type:complete len:227 (+) Transcript_10389:196-876(+)